MDISSQLHRFGLVLADKNPLSKFDHIILRSVHQSGELVICDGFLRLNVVLLSVDLIFPDASIFSVPVFLCLGDKLGPPVPQLELNHAQGTLFELLPNVSTIGKVRILYLV